VVKDLEIRAAALAAPAAWVAPQVVKLETLAPVPALAVPQVALQVINNLEIRAVALAAAWAAPRVALQVLKNLETPAALAVLGMRASELSGNFPKLLCI
jgi:hypothetical protein